MIPVHSITNDFVGLSIKNPIGLYTFPYSTDREATPLSSECARRQQGITERTAAGLDIQPHNHEFYEISIVREGRAIHHTDWGENEVNAGSIIIVPPGLVHAFTDLQAFVQTNIYYQSEWLSRDLKMLLRQDGLVPLFLAADLFNQPAYQRITLLSLDEYSLACCVHEMRDICGGLSSRSPSLLLVEVCFLKLLIILSRAYGLEECSVRTLPFRPEIWAVVEEMEDSLLSYTVFSLNACARRLCVSTRHLSLLFLRDVGLRPREYFQRRRAQHAARLLLTSNGSVTEIAHLLGYTDSAHFCNQFKLLYGASPKAYRQRFL